jgi:hypothetical protein
VCYTACLLSRPGLLRIRQQSACCCTAHTKHVCAGPYNFSNLRSQVPSVMNAAPGDLPESTRAEKENPHSLDIQNSNAPNADSASVLNRIEQKFGIASGRPGSAKRKSECPEPDAGVPKRACVHGAMHPCHRCRQEKARSAPAQGQHADVASGAFHDRSAMVLAEVVPGLLPFNTQNFTQPLQLTQRSDPLPHTGAAPTQQKHLAKAVRMRKQKAPPHRATQVLNFRADRFLVQSESVPLCADASWWLFCRWQQMRTWTCGPQSG